MVACGVVVGSGELLGSIPAGDGHACLPRAPVRAINDDPAVLSDGGLLVQRARRRCVAYVEILVQQARTPIMRSSQEHAFLELRCASDSELAANEVKCLVVIRVTIFNDFQLVSMWCALDHLLKDFQSL